MKKVFSLILLLLLIFTGCSKKREPVNVNKIFLDNNCTNYFYNLSSYPTNTHGSCGFVACTMLLSYYDKYYDNNLIDSKYKEEDGIKHLSNIDMFKLNNEEYYSYLEENKENYFQALLITKMNDKYNIYNKKDKFPCTLYSGNQSRIKEYYSEEHALLDMYLYDIKTYNEYQVKTYRIKEDFRNKVIDLIKIGIPVIISVNYNNKEGHLLVCYDYDSIEDELYGNMGMVNNYNHIKISSLYNYFNCPIYLEMKL